ncbi:MAG TPA: fibronectin type III domain-containing protein [Candidatus Saccharimonadales bacterium]
MKSKTTKRTQKGATMRQSSRRKTTKTVNRSKPWHKSFWRKPSQAIPLLVVVIVVAVGGYLLTFGSHAAPICTPTANYVNPCRPWFGAAVGGNPGAKNNAQTTQFAYLETLLGHSMDVYRDYVGSPAHDNTASKGDPLPLLGPVGQNEKALANDGKALNINWNPAHRFEDAESPSAGGTSYVNGLINKTAANFVTFQRQHPNTKVFLTLYHEINLHTTVNTSGCSPKPVSSYGTAAQFVAAWRNVHNIFQAHGVHDVLWTLSYSSQTSSQCEIPIDWPGSQYVNWIDFDSYDHNNNPNKNTWGSTIGQFYKALEDVPGSIGQQINAVPWGVGEFGTGQNNDQQNVVNYYETGAAGVTDNTYPKLKMYLIFADHVKHTNIGALTDYDSKGQRDSDKQTTINKLVNAIYNTTTTPPHAMKAPTKPTNLHLVLATNDSLTIAWNASTADYGQAITYHVRMADKLVNLTNKTTYTATGLKPGKSYPFQVRAADSAGITTPTLLAASTLSTPPSPPSTPPHRAQPPIIIRAKHGGLPVPIPAGVHPVVNGVITVSASGNSGATTVKVDGTTVSKNGTLNTTYLTNGKHTITLTTSANNASTTTTQIIDVANHLNPWQQTRNQLFSSTRGSSTLMNSSMWTSTVAVVIIVGFVIYRFRKTRINYGSSSSRQR